MLPEDAAITKSSGHYETLTRWKEQKNKTNESRAGIPLIVQDDREETADKLSVGAKVKKTIMDDIEQGGEGFLSATNI